MINYCFYYDGKLGIPEGIRVSDQTLLGSYGTSTGDESNIDIDSNYNISHGVKINAESAGSNVSERVRNMIKESAIDKSTVINKDSTNVDYIEKTNNILKPLPSPLSSAEDESDFVLLSMIVKDKKETIFSEGDVDYGNNDDNSHNTEINDDDIIDHDQRDNNVDAEGIDDINSNNYDRCNESDNYEVCDSQPYDLYQNLVNDDTTYNEDMIFKVTDPLFSSIDLQESGIDADENFIRKDSSVGDICTKNINVDDLQESGIEAEDQEQAEIIENISNNNADIDFILVEENESKNPVESNEDHTTSIIKGTSSEDNDSTLLCSKAEGPTIENDNYSIGKENLSSRSLSTELLATTPSKTDISTLNSPVIAPSFSTSPSKSIYPHNNFLLSHPHNFTSPHKATLPSPPPSYSSHKPTVPSMPSSLSPSPNPRTSRGQKEMREFDTESSESNNR